MHALKFHLASLAYIRENEDGEKKKGGGANVFRAAISQIDE